MFRFFRSQFPHNFYSKPSVLLHRLTSQPPLKVIEKAGFWCSDPHAKCDPMIHTERGGLSDWISTTTNVGSLLQVSDLNNLYIYTIQPTDLKFHVVDYQNSRLSRFRPEQEVLIHEHIPLKNIVAVSQIFSENGQWHLSSPVGMNLQRKVAIALPSQERSVFSLS